MSGVTVLIPYQVGSRNDWLQDAIASVPTGIEYLVLENDGELAEALNEGLKQAETEFVIRLDADDLLDAQSVYMMVDAAWDSDVVYPTWTLVDENLKLIRHSVPGEFCPHRLEVWNYLPSCAVIRREAALEVGGYRDLEVLEDWDLWVRMARAGKRFKWHPETTYYYRQHPGGRNLAMGDELQEKRRNGKQLIVGDEPDLLATFYSQESIATIYWRCTLPSRYLPAQTVLSEPHVQVIGEEIAFPHHRGVAIWQFPGHQAERASMAGMQELGIPVLLEADDNYLTTIPHHSTWTRGMPADIPTGPSIEMHRRISEWVDGIIVPTEQLAKQYRKVTKAPVFVCPNQIDPPDWPSVYERPDWYSPDTTYVGLAASASHMPDMRLVVPALEWASKQDGVEVVVMGLHPELPKHLPRVRFRHIPWVTDMNVARHLQGILDIGMAPIVENAWSSCRSDLKALEYAMGNTTPILSDGIVYGGWTDGERCRKAKTAKEFLYATKELVADTAGRKQLAADARAYVLAERTMEGNIDCWREAISAVTREQVAA